MYQQPETNGDGYADVILWQSSIYIIYAVAAFLLRLNRPLTPNWKVTDSVIYSYFGSGGNSRY